MKRREKIEKMKKKERKTNKKYSVDRTHPFQ
jgi:hypothetical protein